MLTKHGIVVNAPIDSHGPDPDNKRPRRVLSFRELLRDEQKAGVEEIPHGLHGKRPDAGKDLPGFGRACLLLVLQRESSGNSFFPASYKACAHLTPAIVYRWRNRSKLSYLAQSSSDCSCPLSSNARFGKDLCLVWGKRAPIWNELDRRILAGRARRVSDAADRIL